MDNSFEAEIGQIQQQQFSNQDEVN